jgi:hypothetical protein
MSVAVGFFSLKGEVRNLIQTNSEFSKHNQKCKPQILNIVYFFVFKY